MPSGGQSFFADCTSQLELFIYLSACYKHLPTCWQIGLTTPQTIPEASSVKVHETSVFDFNMDNDRQSTAPTKSEINMVIMDYLISEGYPTAAEKFAQETNIAQDGLLDIDSIKARVKIRNAIYIGQMAEAIELIHEFNSELLDHDSGLHFKLLQLQLIEIIRAVLDRGGANPNPADFQPAIDFATQQLAPHAPTNPQHLDALEKTMALMIYKPDKMIPEMQELLDPRLREKVAVEVNKALLTGEGRAPEARIRKLIRARAWAEAQAREASISMPEKFNIGLDAETTILGMEPMVS